MFKNTLIVTATGALLALSSVTFAAEAGAQASGVYLGGDFGYGKIKVTAEDVGATTKNTGFTGGVDVGYKFNQNFAVELGAGMYPTAKAKIGKLKDFDFNKQNYYVDLVGKGIVPLGDSGFELFAKLGAAMAHTQWNQMQDNKIFSKNYFKPVALIGIGADYAVTPNVTVDVQGIATTKYKEQIPAAYSGTIGLTYIF